MRVVKKTQEAVMIEVSPTEYDTLASALGETLEALEDWELPIRTGVDRDYIRQLLSAFRLQDPFPLNFD